MSGMSMSDEPEMALYILPSHPSLVSVDPLGITDAEEPTVWEVIVAILSSFREKTLWDLPSLIENLAYSVHSNGTVDTTFLRRFLAEAYPEPSQDVPQTLFQEIVEHALVLPVLYPDHTLTHLSESHSIETLTPQQVKCLVSHQLLGTLTPPKGNTWGCTFLSWYTEHQPLKNAVNGYLSTLFHFFLASQPPNIPVTYRYITLRELKLKSLPRPWETCDIPLFNHLETETGTAESIKFPHETLKCMLIASNKSPGFGASCTQEELVTGACPALLPLGALFVSPPIPDDGVLVAQGVRPLSEWRGRGRDARVVGLHAADEYTFLLLDALEFDHFAPLDPLSDLVPASLLRELQKAFLGFSALRASNITHIASPLWGAGAFGGDPIVKALILAMAGACAGVSVSVLVDASQTIQTSESSTGSPHPKVIDILNTLRDKRGMSTVQQIWTRINSQEVRACLNGHEVASVL
ncbi:hypothetical protein H0H87_006236 [Tephrocybe sp. NHM501043]|nr:hypothetical protein H0H87_006236 [Tephrocybe sp. NHM501043]